MRKILSAVFLLLFTMNSNANVFLANWNVEGYSQSTSPKGVNIVIAPGVARELRIQFNMTRDLGAEFNSFKYEIEHTSVNGTRTRIPGASYLGYNWQNSYSLNSIFSVTIPADKTEGELKLVLISYSGNQFQESPTIGSYTLNYKAPPVPQPGSIADTEWNKRIVLPGVPGRWSFRNNNGTVVIARNGNYHMDFQSDGNLVLYNGNQALWASGKKLGGNAKLEFNAVGQVETWNLENDSMYWSTGSYYVESRRVVWVLQNDGNFVGYSDYSIDFNGNVNPNNDSFGATMTQGGKKSKRSGRLW